MRSAKYLCFISYASSNEDFVDDLGEALGTELERWVRGKGLFIYKKKLHGGDFIDEIIQSALCKSLCMIIIYTPSYFDKDNTYCAREFKAMEALEEQRLSHISSSEESKHGLIIPIIFRGAEHFPEEIKNKRHYVDFSNYYACYKKLSKHPKYAKEITNIAEYIFNLYKNLDDECIFKDCDKFKLPSQAEIIPWLEEKACPRAQKFPGRRT